PAPAAGTTRPQGRASARPQSTVTWRAVTETDLCATHSKLTDSGRCSAAAAPHHRPWKLASLRMQEQFVTPFARARTSTGRGTGFARDGPHGGSAMKSLLCLFLLASAVAPAAQAAPAVQTTATVNVLVTDRHGKPLPSARVIVNGASGREGSTNGA